jgi:hypothetical protein
MQMTARIVSYFVLGLLILFLGAICVALAFVALPLGAGAVGLGIGARLLYEHRQDTRT